MFHDAKISASISRISEKVSAYVVTAVETAAASYAHFLVNMVLECGSDATLTAEIITKWRTEGYAVVRGLLSESEIAAALSDLQKAFPPGKPIQRDFGSDAGRLEFPCREVPALDNVTMCPRLISAAQRLLATDDVQLIQSDAWAKEGAPADEANDALHNNDQRVHMDYGNNTFMHPSEWRNPEAIAMIVYFSDLQQTGGGTAVVPRHGDEDPAYKAPYIRMPGQAGLPFFNDRSHVEKWMRENRPEIADFRQSLYDRELRVTDAKPGDILLYRHDIWHRGTPVNAAQTRYVMNLAWRRTDAPWIAIWNAGWPKKAYDGWLEERFAAWTPRQRNTLGVPMPGDRYWTREKVENWGARYPGMDITPYLEALGDFD